MNGFLKTQTMGVRHSMPAKPLAIFFLSLFPLFQSAGLGGDVSRPQETSPGDLSWQKVKQNTQIKTKGRANQGRLSNAKLGNSRRFGGGLWGR